MSRAIKDENIKVVQHLNGEKRVEISLPYPAAKLSAPAIHIPRRHQSAPSEHYADKAIKKAAEEIHSGQYVPELDQQDENFSKLNIALGTGNSGVAIGGKPTLDDFQSTHELNELGNHPRVVEALEKLALETDDGKTPEQIEEHAMMMYEMMAMTASRDKWEGQERWEGQENEEKRKGKLLSPWQFADQLFKTIGRERVFLSENFVPSLQNPKSGRLGLYVHNPLYTGGAIVKKEYVQDKAGELRDEGLKKMRMARQLRASGQDTKADAAFQDAGNMAQAATEMLMESSVDEQLAQPPFLRVGSLQAPLGTEWMIMQFDQFGVPVEAMYLGWRTALLTMVRCGAITEKEAHEAFPVVGGQGVSDHYMRQLFLIRNGQGRIQ